jgi:hypothetical protein
VPKYWEPFEEAEEDLTALGYIVLNPSHLPEGMTNEQYMRICFAMIDRADAVLFVKGVDASDGVELENKYAKYVGKPRVVLHDGGVYGKNPRDIVFAWLKHDLEEVFKK